MNDTPFIDDFPMLAAYPPKVQDRLGGTRILQTCLI